MDSNLINVSNLMIRKIEGKRKMSNGQTSKQMDGGKCPMDKQVSKWMKGNVQWTNK